MFKSPRNVAFLFLSFPFLAFAQQDALSKALAPNSSSTEQVAASSRISLEVLVNGNDARPIAYLAPTDFTLLDNGQPRKIVSFRRTDATSGSQFDPPVEVIFVLDGVNLGPNLDALLRLDLEKFLRRDAGSLSHPTSVFIFSSQGLRTQRVPSRDGVELAEELEKTKDLIRSNGFSDYVSGPGDEFRKSIDALTYIATSECKKPGKKVLFWLGRAWPMLGDNRSVATNESQRMFFKAIVSLSRKLRESRMTVYSIMPADAVSPLGNYQNYLKPVLDWSKAEAPDLAVEVLSEHSGGRVIVTRNDMPDRIADCIAETGAYYTLTFVPPVARQVEEYHDLKVQVARPGVTVRNISGYYSSQ